MAIDYPSTGRQLRSLVTDEGILEISLQDVPVLEPQPTQVVVRVEASPINPSDLGLLFAGADMAHATVSGTVESPLLSAPVDANVLRALSARLGVSLPVGNEGAGVVVAAGSSETAQALMGKTVAITGGSMYSQYRTVDVALVMALPEGTSPRTGASAFVNPLTALGMVATMRKEGRTAIVHTAAASNLGQMLVKLCDEEQVPLVNIVRKPEQVETLRTLGAQYICDSSSPSFMSDLIEAVGATSATIGFDATGGGNLASQILTAMEIAAAKNATEYSRYGSTSHKQVYIYGGLDRGPTVLTRSFGFAWGLGGWLLTAFLQSIGPDEVSALRQRVAQGLDTTFASAYTKEVSLAEALQPEAFSVYGRQASGEKYLITPHKT
jgi:NADPH:quinone reductase-like Zn-dependent oxidoreductase